MRLPTYQYTKPSGIEWLGEVPAHWGVIRLKYIVSANDDVLNENTSPEWELLYVDIGSVDAVSGITKKEQMFFEDAPSRARRLVLDGDTIVSTVRTYLKAIAPIHQPEPNLVVSTGFAVVRPQAVEPSFLAFCLRSGYFVETVVSRSTGVSYPATNSSEVLTISVPLPERAEQQAIAGFLEKETARMDRLLGKKRELIERLKEKRAALIFRTVTRGLPLAAARAVGLPENPTLKPTGFDWLGDIPTHWELKKFGYISVVVRGASPRPAGDERYFNGEFIPWITVGEVTKDASMYLTSTETKLTEEGAECSRIIPNGTLVLTNSGATLGVPKILSITGCANDGIVAFLNLHRDASRQFLYYYLSSLTYNLRDRIKQGSGQPNLNTDIIKSLAVPWPPKAEQDAIASYLQAEAAKMDALVGNVEEAIERVQEYRTALITAAVTGKIDVRKAAA